MKKEIIFFNPDVSVFGGVERVLWGITNHFQDDETLHFTIVSLWKQNKKEAFQFHPSVTIQYLFEHESGSSKSFYHKIAANIKLLWKMAFFRYPSNAVIIGTHIKICIYLLLFANHNKQNTIFAAEHAYHNNISSVLKKLRNFFYPHLDGIITLTKTDMDYFVRFTENIYCIPNALPFPPTEKKHPQKIVMSAGRFDPVKNYPLLLRVYKRLAPIFPDWSFLLFGNGPQEQKLKIMLEDSPSNVKIHPFSTEIQKELQKASLYICTSHTEAFPMMLLEAMACGTPVVSFDCPSGPREIISDQEDGVLVPQDDEALLFDAIRDLLADEQKCRKYSKNAENNIKRYLPENIYPLWADIFASASLNPNEKR